MSKTLITFLLLSAIVVSANAQSVRKKTVQLDNYKEVFYIERVSKLPHGFYTKLNKETKVKVVSGEFSKGMRFGKWVFKNPETGKTQLEYNFSENSLVYLDREQYPDSFLVKVDKAFIYTKVDRPLTFIGYKNEEIQILESKIILPKKLKDSGETGESVVQFFVDEKGNITSSNLVSSWNETMEQRLNTIINSLNGRFLPAIKNGKNVPSVFYVNLNVSHISEETIELPDENPYTANINLFYRPETISQNKLNTFITEIPSRGEREEANK